MEDNFTLTEPKLRNELPENVVEYLNDTYPPRTNKAGIKQNDGLNYITQELNLFEDSDILKCVEQYGSETFLIFSFLRIEMAKDLGWGLDVTEKKRKRVFFDIEITFDYDKNDIERWVNGLIEYGILKVVNDSDGNTYWTNMQQFYNYEYKSYTRLKNNAKQRKYYRKKHEQDESNNNDAYFPPSFEETSENESDNNTFFLSKDFWDGNELFNI